jgi:hypothetical protein
LRADGSMSLSWDLRWAVEKGDDSEVERLLAEGVDVNDKFLVRVPHIHVHIHARQPSIFLVGDLECLCVVWGQPHPGHIPHTIVRVSISRSIAIHV